MKKYLLLASLLFLIGSVYAQWPVNKNYSYDFGIKSGIYNTLGGNSISDATNTGFLPAPASGAARISIHPNAVNGSFVLGGNYTLKITQPLERPIKFSNYGLESATDVVYAKCKMSFSANSASTSAGSYTWAFGNSNMVAASNSLFKNTGNTLFRSTSEIFSALRWTLSGTNTITFAYRYGSDASATTTYKVINGATFVQGNTYEIEVYCNNSGEDNFYTKSSLNYFLPNNRFDVWVDGVRLDENFSRSIEVSGNAGLSAGTSIALANGNPLNSYLFISDGSAAAQGQLTVSDLSLVYDTSVKPIDKGFKVFNGMRYKNSVFFDNMGLVPLTIIYDGIPAITCNENNCTDTLNKEVFRKRLDNYVSQFRSSQYIVFDFEKIVIGAAKSEMQAKKQVQLIKQFISWTREAYPNAKLGMYDYDYDDNKFSNIKAELFRDGGFDFFAPTMYQRWQSLDEWKKNLRAAIKNDKTINPAIPIYAFVSPFKKGDTEQGLLSDTEWLAELSDVRQLLDGVIIWTQNKTTDILNTQQIWIESLARSYFPTYENPALPVNLVKFTAKAENNHIVLSWKTASENGNSHFELERSEDGQNFTKIATVSGKATKGEMTNYSYIDASYRSTVIYYRLKQVDFDGGFMYIGGMLAVKNYLDTKNYQLFLSKENTLNTVITTYKAGASTFKILDIWGRTLMKSEIFLESGLNKNVFDITGLPKGTYIGVLNNGGEEFIRKFVK